MSVLEQYLIELEDMNRPVTKAKFANLSGLSREEIEVFKKRWPNIQVSRRREIVGDLVEVAEDNFEMDFNGVLRATLSDTDPEIKVKAIEGLWICEDRSFADQLIRLLLGDSEASVRAAAASGLRKFSLLYELEAIPERDGAKVEKAMLAAHNDKKEQLEVRRRALEGLSPFGKPLVKQLIREAYENGNHDLKISALFSMGQNADPSWLPILLQELNSNDAAVRFEAARACGEIESEKAVTGLIALLQDHDHEVQLSAIEALGNIGGTMAKRALQESLSHPDDAIREAAREVLDEMLFWEDPLKLA